MKLEEHPLWPTIMEWAENSPRQVVPWAPKHEFQHNVDMAALANPIWGHEHAKEQFWKAYRDAAALGKALVGGSYNSDVHAMIYRVSEHRFGDALCRAAGTAWRRPGFCANFSDSTRLDGFVRALEAWTPHILQEGFDGKAELPWVIRTLSGKEDVAADFWLDACKFQIGDSVAFGKTFAKEIGRAEASARMKKRRGEKAKMPEFKDFLKLYWVPAALWCRSDSEIVEILTPDRKTNMTAAYNRVRRDISELGFAFSRRKSS
ncbi:MAG: hypothetical protein WCK77_22855 [Verrucomicrobiota bacterium]